MRREVFFLPAAHGERFCLLTRPAGKAIGAVLFVHAFAEEMNKSRAMVASAAAAAAGRGLAVLQLDLRGCGDSSGDFGDATWQDWLDDLSLGWSWLGEYLDCPRVIWAMRAGALVAADWVASLGEAVPMLLWQPVGSGRQHLTQFLRLRLAADMIDEKDARSVVGRLRDQLESGAAVEVAGYEVSPGLASGVERAEFPPSGGGVSSAVIIEVVSVGRSEPTPALRRVADRLSSGGARVDVRFVPGVAFWQTQELERVPALVDETALALERLVQ